MNCEYEIQKLQTEVADLRNTLIQTMANMTPMISKIDNSANKVDDTSNKVDALTPTVITKQGYIDDTEVVFNNVPSGNVTVYVEDENGSFLNYSISRVTDMITVSFDRPLEYTATITLSIL